MESGFKSGDCFDGYTTSPISDKKGRSNRNGLILYYRNEKALPLGELSPKVTERVKSRTDAE